MKQIAVILILSAIVVSCKKNSSGGDTYTIAGIVKDYDTRAPIAGAKVFVAKGNFSSILTDSAISDAAGKVSFTYSRDDDGRVLLADKTGYLTPVALIQNYPVATSRTQEILLGKASTLQLTLHKQNSYQPLDSLSISVNSGYLIYGNNYIYNSLQFPIGQHQFFRRANSPDTIYSLGLFKFSPPMEKAKFQWEIKRNGVIISSGNDSTDLVQYGIKTHTLNY